jgi:hypothetical protein
MARADARREAGAADQDVVMLFALARSTSFQRKLESLFPSGAGKEARFQLSLE